MLLLKASIIDEKAFSLVEPLNKSTKNMLKISPAPSTMSIYFDIVKQSTFSHQVHRELGRARNLEQTAHLPLRTPT